MPLWDSVQRSLEKASQEAARIARTQRLRSSIDGLSRQINTQNNNLLNKTMDLFRAGQLTQSELLPLCQELTNLQQQLNSAQAELRQIQAQAQASGQQPQTGAPNAYPSPGAGGPPYSQAGDEVQSTTYAPPPPEYQSYLESTQGMTVAPPPPGVESLTVSAMETIQMPAEVAPPSSPAARRCAFCQAELAPENAFCYSCGAPVQDINAPHSPTMRAGNMEPLYPEGQATVRSGTSEPANLQGLASTGEEPMRANAPLHPSPAPVSEASPATVEKDKGT
jgi:hypothetical protein